jgi:hypothetical protein
MSSPLAVSERTGYSTLAKQWIVISAFLFLCQSVGLGISLGRVVARQMPGFEVWVNPILWGLALGLSASGPHSGAKRVWEGLDADQEPMPHHLGLPVCSSTNANR